jgi:DNA-binding HxlR family transcriptional regulator
MNIKTKEIFRPKKSEYRKLEDVIGCKWSVSVLVVIQRGIHRPGEIERAIENISKKVLAERFRKLVAFGLLNKMTFNEILPHSEYHLTPKGKKLVGILSQIDALDKEL